MGVGRCCGSGAVTGVAAQADALAAGLRKGGDSGVNGEDEQQKAGSACGHLS